MGAVRDVVRGGVFLAVAAAVVPAVHGQDLKVYWKDSLRLETADQAVKLKLGGRIHNDWAWFDQDSDVEAAVGDAEDGTEFRRARIYLEGLLRENVEFKFQHDFATGTDEFQDMYVGLLDLPPGNLRAGQFFEPFGLETQTSSNQTTFLERSLVSALTPARHTGLMLWDTAGAEQRVRWAVGGFRTTNAQGMDTGDGDYSLTARLTGLPVWQEEGRRYVHLGAAFSARAGDDFGFKSRPEAHLLPNYVDTGAILGNDQVNLLGLEAAGVWGPASLQGEYVLAMAEADAGSDPDFDAYSVQAAWFLTGEHRPYKMEDGVFGYPTVRAPYRKDGGLGAFEVAARVSNLDLDDGSVNGGDLDDYTLGLNWYLNQNARVMLDYVLADLDGVGNTGALMLRFQLFF